MTKLVVENRSYICEKCNSKTHYSEKHDARYCKKCDIWLSINCGNKNCRYCRNRPKRPSMTKIKRIYDDDWEYKICPKCNGIGKIWKRKVK